MAAARKDDGFRMTTCSLCGKKFEVAFPSEYAWRCGNKYLCSYTCTRKAEREKTEKRQKTIEKISVNAHGIRYTDEQKEECVRLYKESRPKAKDISQATGMSVDAVIRCLKAAGIYVPRNPACNFPRKEIDIGLARRMKAEGQTYDQIAEALGVARCTVIKKMQEARHED